MHWRWLLENQPGDPVGNMRYDAELLAALQGGQIAFPTIRLYRWDRPVISYGRLQNEAVVQSFYPNLPCVRRPTGGRAVLHGQDLTITVATLAKWLPDGDEPGVLGSYRRILAGVIAALDAIRVPVGFGGRGERRESKNVMNCFDLALGCDLINKDTGCKITGSAQRREGQAILQQMSVPLAILPDCSAFTRILKSTFQDALQIEGWLTIDTSDAVWYTEDEESEGV